MKKKKLQLNIFHADCNNFGEVTGVYTGIHSGSSFYDSARTNKSTYGPGEFTIRIVFIVLLSFAHKCVMHEAAAR